MLSGEDFIVKMKVWKIKKGHLYCEPTTQPTTLYIENMFGVEISHQEYKLIQWTFSVSAVKTNIVTKKKKNNISILLTVFSALESSTNRENPCNYFPPDRYLPVEIKYKNKLLYGDKKIVES